MFFYSQKKKKYSLPWLENSMCSSLHPVRHFYASESQEPSVHLYFPGYSFLLEQCCISVIDINTLQETYQGLLMSDVTQGCDVYYKVISLLRENRNHFLVHVEKVATSERLFSFSRNRQSNILVLS